jgi:hypothetical protein
MVLRLEWNSSAYVGRMSIWNSRGYELRTEILLEIIYYSPSDVENRATVPVKLQWNTAYMGTTCWFNLSPEQESATDDFGVESPEFNYIKEASANVSPLFSLSCPSVSATCIHNKCITRMDIDLYTCIRRPLSPGLHLDISLTVVLDRKHLV